MTDYDARTALIVVDVQNDFADPKGSLYVSEGERVVPLINDEIERATEAGALVVYTQDWHPESTPHFAKDGGIWPVHCVRDTWGAELHPDLRVTGEPGAVAPAAPGPRAACARTRSARSATCGCGGTLRAARSS